METKNRQNLKRLLMYIGIGGGIIVLSFAAPQLPYVLLKSYFKNKKLGRQKFNNSLAHLKRRGFIDYKRSGDLVSIKLTAKGKNSLGGYKFDLLEIKKPQKWDKKWRLVIFDIPHSKKSARDSLRRKLKSLGFVQIQKSAFIHPYECEEEVKKITDFYDVYDCVRIMIVEKLGDGKVLKEMFNLL